MGGAHGWAIWSAICLYLCIALRPGHEVGLEPRADRRLRACLQLTCMCCCVLSRAQNSVWSAGIVMGLIDDIPTCDELLSRMVRKSSLLTTAFVLRFFWLLFLVVVLVCISSPHFYMVRGFGFLYQCGLNVVLAWVCFLVPMRVYIARPHTHTCVHSHPYCVRPSHRPTQFTGP